MGKATDDGTAVRRAVRAARAYDVFWPKAVAVSYHRRERRVHLELSSGVLVAFPVDYLEKLSGARDQDLAKVTISPSGHSLHWPILDADFLVEGLLTGVLGSREWMRRIGRKGGRARSERKTAAARANGAKGGRPQAITRSGRTPRQT